MVERMAERMREELSKEIEYKLKVAIENQRIATEGLLMIQFIYTNCVLMFTIHNVMN